MKIKNLKYMIGAFVLAIPLSFSGCKNQQEKEELAILEEKIVRLQKENETILKELEELEKSKSSVSSQLITVEPLESVFHDEKTESNRIEKKEKQYQMIQIPEKSTIQIRIFDRLTETQFLDFLSVIQDFPKEIEYLQITNYACNQQSSLSSYSDEISEKFQTVMRNFSNLKGLSLIGLGIEDISFVSQNSNLESLSLCYNHITNMQALSSLENLKYLFLEGNSITDLTPISNLTNLIELDFQENPISNLSALSYCTHLKKLNLKDCQFISDVKPLENMIDLTTLIISNNQISNIDSLSQLPNLYYLDCSHNQISQLPNDFLATNLQIFNLKDNQIVDFSPLANLTHLTNLDITENGDEIDLSFLHDFYFLNYLNLNPTSVTNVSSLEDSKIAKNNILTINGELSLQAIEDLKMISEKQKELKK